MAGLAADVHHDGRCLVTILDLQPALPRPPGAAVIGFASRASTGIVVPRHAHNGR